MSSIDLNDRNQYPIRINAGAAEVWTKARWDDAFVPRPDLTPVQSVWVASPDFNTAALEYRYGRVLVPGAREYSTLTKITARGYWVLIRWQSDNGSPIDWLGYAETPITRDHYPARDSLPETGKQSIRCFGLMRALQHTIVDNTVYVDPEDDEAAKRSGGTGAEFNAGMRGNRSKTKRQLNGEGPAAYVFAHPNDWESTWWSTRDIVEHLAAFHLPTPASVPIDGGVPWQVTNLQVLPEWDRPSIATDLRAVSSILMELIEPSKMLNFGIGITGSGGPPPNITAVTINPYSLLADPLTLPAGTLPANTSQFELSWSKDPLTRVVIDEDSSAVYDQVIVQGPREIAICTLAGYPVEESTHMKGWLLSDEDDYSEGASLAPEFNEATEDRKREMNERFRTSGEMRNVYSLYRLKEKWDGKLFDEPVFQPQPNNDGETEPYAPCPLAFEFLDHLPLYAEVDYSGNPTAVDESNGLTRQRPLFGIREKLADGTYSDQRLWVDPTGRLTMQAALLKARPFTLDYEFEDNCNIRLIVRDAPQHAIAGKEFIGNAADLDQETLFGNINHLGWTLTIAIRGDRRPRWSIPSMQQVANLDVVRRKIVTLEDESLESVYISKGAYVGFKANESEAVKSPGGLLRNPLPILQSICMMLAKQHGQPRRRVEISTGRRLPQLQLGSMLRSVETATGPTEAVITEMRIDAPMIEGDGAPAAPKQTIIASPYRLDVLSMLRTRVGNATQVARPRRIATPEMKAASQERRQRGKR